MLRNDKYEAGPERKMCVRFESVRFFLSVSDAHEKIPAHSAGHTAQYYFAFVQYIDPLEPREFFRQRST